MKRSKMAGAMAKRLEMEAGDDRSRIDLAFRLAYGRRPGPEESETLLSVVKREGLFPACRAILNANEFVFVD